LIRETEHPGVFTDGDRLYTRNLRPGTRVYGERLQVSKGVEYREWIPSRSKLAAFLKLGGKRFPLRTDSRVLYLGAASGTTASHVADIAREGVVYCVEFSPRAFRDLVAVCDQRRNMIPILADASQPSTYDFAVEGVEMIYQDVAQRGQAAILIKNMKAFDIGDGMLALKSRSENVSLPPKKVYETAVSWMRSQGLGVHEILPLDPLERDHAMMVVSR